MPSSPVRRSLVLNVNDDETRRYLLGRVLRDGGFDVVEAATGAAALELASSARPDAILLDVKLPDLDGFEVCRRVKADAATAMIPVVMFSSVLVEPMYRVHGLESGADGYLTDPLQPPVAIATLRALLRARAAEDARHESEAQYRTLFESNPLPSWVVDLDTLEFVLVNDAAVRAFGYTREQFTKLPATALRPPEDVPEMLELLALPTRGADGPTAVRYQRADGSVFDAEITTRRMRYHERDTRLVVVQDVTDRKRNEARLATQLAVTRVLADSPGATDAVPRLLAAIGRELRWDVGEYWARDERTDSLVLAEFWCSDPVDARELEAAGRLLSFRRGQGLPGAVWEARRAMWSPDVGRDFTFVRIRCRGDLHTAISFPVTHGDEVSGIMLFFSRDVRQADVELLRAIWAIGAQIGEFMERRRAEAALREAEARYRMAASATNDVIWDWDAARDVVTVSDAMRTQLGDAPDATGRSAAWFVERIHPDDQTRVVDELARVIAGTGSAWVDEFRFRAAEGSYATVSNRAFVVRDAAGCVLRMVGAVSDITERTLAEERRRLRALSLGTLRAREEEARRIARELHDEASQLLASVHIAVDRLAAEAPSVDRSRVNEIKALLELTETEVRRIAHELRPTVLDDLGLAPALEVLADNVTARTGTTVAVDAPSERRLPALIETALYRIVQEALTNATRHGRAGHVDIRVACDDETVRCVVADDGSGFVPADVVSRAERGLGLIGIEERLAPLGGKLEIDSAPGLGTRLMVTIPLSHDGVADPAR
ncbi:MAG: PAS domain S-box protein [Candidatus Rokubacteria bacterium]|nr:PAS domain S-box protein [Candidatus Rokubacteria bacterium]